MGRVQMGAVLFSILSDVISGVVAGVVLACMAWLYSACQAWRVERQMRRQFFPRGLSQNLGGWGMIIENKTGTEVTVRDFSLVGESSDGKGGEATIKMHLEPSSSDKAITTTPDGWAIMPPFTKGTFNAPPAKQISEWKYLGKLKGGRVVIEYCTLVGTRKLVTIEPDFDSLEQRDVASSFTKIFNAGGVRLTRSP